jgi:hypothetical protein
VLRWARPSVSSRAVVSGNRPLLHKVGYRKPLGPLTPSRPEGIMPPVEGPPMERRRQPTRRATDQGLTINSGPSFGRDGL